MATVRLRKDRHGNPAYWQLSYTQDGQRQRKNIGAANLLSRREANDICKAKSLELSTGGRLLNLGFRAATLFKDYALEYLLWHQSEYPDSNYRIAQIVHQYLMPEFGNLPLDLITPKHAEEYKRKRRRNAKANTVTKELRTLKAVINRAVEEKVIDENPIQHVSAPQILDSKPHLFYEADQLKALYAACTLKVNAGEGPQPNPLHAAIYRLYVNTGMRRGEGMHLKKRWVGRDGIKIVSTGEERTKSGEWREVPKTEGAAEALDRLKRAETGEYVLPRVTLPSLSRAFVRDARRAELPGSLHTLRHTYISHLVRDTPTPLRTVQLYAGHASITTTEIYLYLRANLGGTPAAKLAL